MLPRKKKKRERERESKGVVKRDQEEKETKQIFVIKESPMKGSLGLTPQNILKQVLPQSSLD